jgi:hypothetical protein
LPMDAAPRQTSSKDSIVVLANAITEDADPSEIVESNVTFVNMLFEEYLKPEEISQDALRSYYVDHFLAEYENGGFSQYVYNTRWDAKVVSYVRDGLKAMGAKRYLKAFEKCAKLVEAVGKEKLEAYLNGGYFHDGDEDEDEEPVDWEVLDEVINKAGCAEDIAELHGAWLRKHPHLYLVQTEDDMREEARRRGAALPDRAQRIAKALAGEPRYLKLIRALCKEAGQELDRLTTIDPRREFEGEFVHAYHFITDEGHHHMVNHGGKAFMFRGHSTTDEVCSIDAPEEEVMH